MKKFLVVLLMCTIAFGAFAQISVSGSVRAKGVYGSNGGGGWYGMTDGFGILNDNSRIVFNGNWDGKAGVNAELRFGTYSGVADTLVKLQNFSAWAQPAKWFKVNLGWMDIGDYIIKDSTATTAFGGDMRNTSKLDPLGGLAPCFGALAQFMPLDGNLNIGVALTSDGRGDMRNAENMIGYLAVLYKIPNIGKLVVDFQMNTTGSNTADYIRASATFQYQSKVFDIAGGVKYNSKAIGGKKGDNVFTKMASGYTDYTGNFNIMVLGSVKAVEKLGIDFGLEFYCMNGMGLADTISVSYDFGVVKPLIYMYGFTGFDNEKMIAKVGKNFSNVIGAEVGIPIKVGKSSMLAVGLAYDTGVESFQVPCYFRLFF